MVTRFSILPDERKVLMGVDKAEVFKPGIVYEAEEICGEIIIVPMGKYCLKQTGYPSELSETGTIMYSGLHLITEKEYQEVLKNLDKKE